MRIYYFIGSLLLLISCNARVEFPAEIEAQLPEKIDFNLHVKPILSDRCFACHGPDAANQESGFRLNTEESALAAPGRRAGVNLPSCPAIRTTANSTTESPLTILRR